MKNIRLLKPTLDYAEEIMQFRQEIVKSQDNEFDKFAGCGSLQDCQNAEEWLTILDELENVDTCPKGYVTSTSYIAIRESDNKIVGIIDLRHHIDHPILGLWGGHMGYSVRPSERGKGYAKEMLRQNLENCRARGIHKVMITCDCENLASEKTILANDGVLEKEILVDGHCVKRYWITVY